MQKLKSSVLTTWSCPKFSLKPEVSQNIALHASPLTRNSCLLICSVPVHSPFCCFLLLVCFQKSFSGIKCIVSCMCPQHMIAAQLIFTSCWCIFPCLDPTEYTHRIKPHTILVTLIAQIYLGHRICLTKALFYHNMIQKTAEFCVSSIMWRCWNFARSAASVASMSSDSSSHWINEVCKEGLGIAFYMLIRDYWSWLILWWKSLLPQSSLQFIRQVFQWGQIQAMEDLVHHWSVGKVNTRATHVTELEKSNKYQMSLQHICAWLKRPWVLWVLCIVNVIWFVIKQKCIL